MAVVQGNSALASEYNTLRNGVTKWFADGNVSGIVFGDANQTWGWGGGGSGFVSQGNPMLASQMNSLVDRCNIGENICTNVIGTLPQVVATAGITAAEFNNIETKSNLINTNRLNIDPAETSLATPGSSVRTTSYSTSIDCTFTYTFTSFDKARYFFNSGGTLGISGTITGYSSGTGFDGAGIYEILSTMGNIEMGYTATTQSGTGGIIYGLGYYDLATTYVRLFLQGGTGAYSNATVGVDGRYSSSGSVVEIRVMVAPEPGRIVDGTTTIYAKQRKLNNQASGAASLTVTAPAYTLTEPL